MRKFGVLYKVQPAYTLSKFVFSSPNLEMSAIKRKNAYHGKNDFRGLEEAVNALLCDDSETDDVANPDLIIIPPELDPLTDSEEFDEDNLDDNELPTDLPGRIELNIDDHIIECEPSPASAPLSVINSSLEELDQPSTSASVSRSNSISVKYLSIGNLFTYALC